MGPKPKSILHKEPQGRHTKKSLFNGSLTPPPLILSSTCNFLQLVLKLGNGIKWIKMCNEKFKVLKMKILKMVYDLLSGTAMKKKKINFGNFSWGFDKFYKNHKKFF